MEFQKIPFAEIIGDPVSFTVRCYSKSYSSTIRLTLFLMFVPSDHDVSCICLQVAVYNADYDKQQSFSILSDRLVAHGLLITQYYLSGCYNIHFSTNL